MQEYIVGLNKDVDYNAFWNEIQTTTNGLTYIPDRAVNIANERKGSQRLTHYTLSDSEAELLKNDPRVYCVEIPPSERDDISIEVMSIQTSTFPKNATNDGANSNWGLVRSISKNNNFGLNPESGDKYLYTLDGTGVDIVIQDSGVQTDHPEFNGRVENIDWYAASGITGTQNANHNRDYFGHGTHVAGIAAGKTFGWGKNAKILSQKIKGLEGTGDENTGIPESDGFDCIRLWHAAKSGSRPTVVNMSWGYYSRITPSKVNYRGTYYSSSYANYGLMGESGGSYRFPVRVASTDIEIQEMIDAGIHVVTSAGNDYTKIDIPGGNDYDNYISSSTGNVYYYHRGGSPHDDEAISVGNLYSASYDANTDSKNWSSNCGPAVDLYAPGTNILSSVSTVCAMSSDTGSYFADNNYKQMTLSGTSMASPQVAGYLSLVLQVNPSATPDSVKQSLINNCGNALYSSNQDNDYSNHDSIKGSEKRILFNKFGNSEIPLKFNLPINANISLK